MYVKWNDDKFVYKFQYDRTSCAVEQAASEDDILKELLEFSSNLVRSITASAWRILMLVSSCVIVPAHTTLISTQQEQSNNPTLIDSSDII